MQEVALASNTLAIRVERTRAMLEAPDAMMVVCAHICDGGSLTGLAELWDIRFSEVMRWIRADKLRLRQYTDAMADRSEWVKETVLAEIRKLALNYDIRRILDDKGRLLPPDDWPEEMAAAVISVEVHELEEFNPMTKEREVIGHAKKIKMVDRLAAIKLLGQSLAMFTERHEVDVRVTMEQLVGKAHKARAVDVKVIEASLL